jgi:nucleoside transporter
LRFPREEFVPMSTPAQDSSHPASEITSRAGEVGIVPLEMSVRVKLSIMMFLQYFTWGAFFVTLGTYLGSLDFTGQRIGLAYGTSALGAIIAPFFVGMIADRFFATQKILFVLHLLGAVLLYAVSQVTEFAAFYPLMLLYFICYMPTLALTNSLSFAAMTSPEKQFPGIRVLGTIGWIAAGIFVGMMQWEAVNTALQVAAISSAVLAFYCLALPNTPPPNAGKKITASDVLGLDALSLLKQWSFLVFVVGSFLICIPLQFYYGFTNLFLNDIGVENAAGKMTVGQMSEIFFMLIMPVFFVRLGVKWMLLVGMACWAFRYVLFAYGRPDDSMWMLYIGIALHGICYDFFFVTGYIYVDKKAPQAIRASAQGFITLVTLGIGGFIGTWLAGVTADMFTTEGKVDWQQFWLVPAAAAAVVMVLFALTFFDRVDESQSA